MKKRKPYPMTIELQDVEFIRVGQKIYRDSFVPGYRQGTKIESILSVLKEGNKVKMVVMGIDDVELEKIPEQTTLRFMCGDFGCEVMRDESCIHST